MYIWEDELRAVNTIVRMGRGAQMGVDHNKGLAWVGGSAGFLAYYIASPVMRSHEFLASASARAGS